MYKLCLNKADLEKKKKMNQTQTVKQNPEVKPHSSKRIEDEDIKGN